MTPPSVARSALLILLCFTIVALSACGDSVTNGDDGGTVVTITVSPPTGNLTFVGATLQLTASAKDANGGTVSVTPTWTSSSSEVATVTSGGLVTAVANGTATITGAAAGASGSAALTVLQTASSIVVTPGESILQTGKTQQLAAEVKDSGGTTLATPSLTWTSSDDALATVNQSGLVSAVRKGEVVITAARDGVAGTADFTIELGDLMPTEDVVLTGTVEVGEVAIPADVTVTVTGGLTLMAEGPISVAGAIAGPCESLDLESEISVILTGTVNLACAQIPVEPTEVPSLRIAGPEMLFDGVTVQVSGPLSFVITPPASASVVGAYRASSAPGHVTYSNATIIADPAKAEDGASGTVGGDGGPGVGWIWENASLGTATVTFENSTIRGQDGGNGGRGDKTGSETTLSATGGDGGQGGSLFVSGSSGITFVDGGGNSIQAGHGGQGGPAVAVAEPTTGTGGQAPSASARGGWGGEAGTSVLPTGRNGDAGRGGNARATGAAGKSADEMGGAAQIGGNATAHAGNGGPGPSVPGEGGTWTYDPNKWGAAGNAFATGGRGGSGGVPSPDGAAGGAMTTRGGLTTLERDALIGTHTVMGGRGGDGLDACSTDEVTIASVISVLWDPANTDQLLFQAGPGGIDLSLTRLFENQNQAGKGGAGGVVEVEPGSYLDTGVTSGRAHLVITGAANGGDGGDGIPPGAGGTAGLRSLRNDPVIDSETGSFTDGSSGIPCAAMSPRRSGVSVTVVGDASQAARAITFTSGDSRWVSVTGTLNDNNIFTASGRGRVAGTDGVLVLFAGIYDPATGALAADYTMDSEKIINANHPIVYRVVATGG